MPWRLEFHINNGKRCRRRVRSSVSMSSFRHKPSSKHAPWPSHTAGDGGCMRLNLPTMKLSPSVGFKAAAEWASASANRTPRSRGISSYTTPSWSDCDMYPWAIAKRFSAGRITPLWTIIVAKTGKIARKWNCNRRKRKRSARCKIDTSSFFRLVLMTRRWPYIEVKNCSAVLDGQLYANGRRHCSSTSAVCQSAEDQI